MDKLNKFVQNCTFTLTHSPGKYKVVIENRNQCTKITFETDTRSKFRAWLNGFCGDTKIDLNLFTVNESE